jgi:FtsP/CotA-like multicopper oxidase with cupredoxin domain
VEFTAQNVYKGLAGFYLLFNQFDTGNETTGFHLPGVRPANDFYAPVQFDIPLMLNDKVFDPRTGLLFFDLFNRDGILGDKFMVNGKIQPFLVVKPRRYRFRILNGGPSRFYRLFLTDKGTNTSIPMWQIANDGNLLPRPVKVTSTNIIGVAERFDFVIDFRPWAGKTLYFENRLIQTDGVGPDDGLRSPGSGDFMLQFRVDTGTVPDNSVDFEATVPQFYTLPTVVAPRVTRTFVFDDSEGWTINEQPMPPNCDVVRFRVKQNTAENWILQNDGTWSHPIHIHFEEFQILTRNGRAPGVGNPELSRKDVGRLGPDDRLVNFFRFRDFEGRYPMHCHNTIHEDHAMMLRWDIDQTGDLNTRP